MDSHFTSIALPILALSLALAVCAQASSFENIKCENLGKENCTYAVSYSGHRCILEKSVTSTGEEKYSCRNSFIDAANNLKNWIETDHCLFACGLDRYSLGISSDALLDSRFAQRLCSSHCQAVCPNIVDLYSNLAAGEGVFLPQYCEAQTTGTRRGMAEVMSSGTDGVAAAPADAEELDGGPSQAMGSRRGMAEVMSSGTDGVAPAPADAEELDGAPSQAMGFRRGMAELLSSGMDGVAPAPADAEESDGAPSQAMGFRRGMAELLSSGMDGVASAPADGEEPLGAPSPSPVAL